MKVALFFGHYSSNIGDLAINSGLSSFLRSAIGSKLKLTVFFLNEDGSRLGGRDSFGDNIRADFVGLPTLPSAIVGVLNGSFDLMGGRNMSDFDLVLINGGEHFFSLPHNKNTFNLFWRGMPIISASAAGIRSIVLPSTFGPFDGEPGRFFLDEFIGRSSVIMVRDSISRELINGCLPDNPTAEEFLDLAFHIDYTPLLDSKTSPRTIGLVSRLESFGLRAGAEASSKVALQRKESRFSNSLAFRTTCELAENLIGEGYTIRLFIQAESDRALAEALRRHLSSEFGSTACTLHEPKTLDNYLEFLSQCTCVITSRLHAAILSIVAGTPVIGFFYEEHGHKMPGVFKQIESDELCFRVDQDSAATFADSICSVVGRAVESFPSILSLIAGKKLEDIASFKSLAEESEVRASPLPPLEGVPDWFAELISGSEKVFLASLTRQIKMGQQTQSGRVQEELESYYAKLKRLSALYNFSKKKNDSQLKVMRKELQSLQQDLESYYAKLKTSQFQLSSSCAELRQRARSLAVQVEDLQRQLEDLRLSNNSLEGRIRSMVERRSWRLTSPFRFLFGLLRRFRLLRR